MYSHTCPNAGGASAHISQPAHVVKLPEVRAMANLSRKTDFRVAQFGLADSSESSDSDREDSDVHGKVRKKGKISNAGKSIRSEKVSSVLLTVAATSNTRSLHSRNLLPVTVRSFCPRVYRRSNVGLLFTREKHVD